MKSSVDCLFRGLSIPPGHLRLERQHRGPHARGRDAHATRLLGPVLAGLLCVCGCARHVQSATPAASPTSAPATRPNPSPTSEPARVFSNSTANVELHWPDGWKTESSKDYVWMIVPVDAKNDDAFISLDIPDLPMHIPGMIPIGSVESGYLDDLRKNYKKIDTQDLKPPAIPNAKLRMVRAAWKQDARDVQQIALLIVHDDHVLIVRERSEVGDEARARRIFDDVIGTLRWTSSAVGKR